MCAQLLQGSFAFEAAQALTTRPPSPRRHLVAARTGHTGALSRAVDRIAVDRLAVGRRAVDRRAVGRRAVGRRAVGGQQVSFALAVCFHVLAAARHPALPAAPVADALAAAALRELVAPERLAPVAPA